MIRLTLVIALVCFASELSMAVPKKGSSRASIAVLSREPYAGAIAVDAATGKVLSEDRADAPAYPGSIVKLMDLLLILERADAGILTLTNRVIATAEATRMGGSQVFLKEHEVFPVEELLYALMVQSANDAAVALALHVGGTRERFVQMMNQRAGEIGMGATQFHSPHGLPPSAGQLPDVSTARDLARLARELVKRSDILKYSSTVKRGFRNHTMDMMNHNRLLGTVEGCDGLKTGYFLAAGYSIVATAQRGGRRVIAVVLGSKSRSVRDAAASRLLAESFARLPPLTPEAGEAVAAARPPATGEKGAVRAAPADTPREGAPRRGWRRTAKFVTVVVALLAIAGYIQRRRDLGGLSGYGPGSGAKKK